MSFPTGICPKGERNRAIGVCLHTVKWFQVFLSNTNNSIYYESFVYIIKWLHLLLDGNYTRMLRAILNKSWRQHPTRQKLYGHLPPITETIQARQTRHAGHCWRSKDELISDVLLWSPAYGEAKARRPARTYIQQLCENTGCSPEDLPEAIMIGRSGERGTGISVLAARHDDDDDDCYQTLFYFRTVLSIKF